MFKKRNLSRLIATFILTQGSCVSSRKNVRATVLDRRSEFVSELTDGSNINFKSHKGSGPLANFLAISLPFEPANTLKKKIETDQNIKLKDRGESHVTIITPTEFSSALAKHMSQNDIDAIAKQHDVQKSKLTPVCIGKFEAQKTKKQSVYFVVIESQDLMDIRKDVETLFIKKGGSPGEFSAKDYSPHITLGFSERDLHKETDGAIKDNSSCLENSKENPNDDS